jgi:CRISPR system Cascade subunit CasE
MLANPHLTHGMVCQALPNEERERTLWRFENDPRRAHLIALTQSRPAWGNVIEAAGWEGTEAGQARIADMAPELALARTGRRFSFKVRVNPVTAKLNPQEALDQKKPADSSLAQGERRSRGVRVAERTASQQTRWFERRAESWGFKILPLSGPLAAENVLDLVLTERDVFKFRHGPDTVTLSTATFGGNLEVIDGKRFRRSIVEGVGPGKAYGCGLLLLGAGRAGEADG